MKDLSYRESIDSCGVRGEESGVIPDCEHELGSSVIFSPYVEDHTNPFSNKYIDSTNPMSPDYIDSTNRFSLDHIDSSNPFSLDFVDDK